MQIVRVAVETEQGSVRGAFYRGILVAGAAGDALAYADVDAGAASGTEWQARTPALYYQSVAEFVGEAVILEALTQSSNPND